MLKGINFCSACVLAVVSSQLAGCNSTQTSTSQSGTSGSSGSGGSSSISGPTVPYPRTAHFLYLLNTADESNHGSIAQYSLSSEGTPTLITSNSASGSITTGLSTQGVVIDPIYGNYLYAVNTISNNISQFLIGADGSLGAIPNEPATVSTGSNPYSLAVDPYSHFVYTVNSSDDTISEFSIGSNGALTSIGTAPITNGSLPTGIIIDSTGKYLYAFTKVGANINEYTIGSNGKLTPISGNNDIAVYPGTGFISEDICTLITYANSSSNSLYYIGAAGDLFQYSIGANGALTFVAQAKIATSLASVAVDSVNGFLYASDQLMNNVTQFNIGTNGEIGSNPLNTMTVGSNGSYGALALDATGKNLYSMSAPFLSYLGTYQPAVHQYSISLPTGTPTYVNGWTNLSLTYAFHGIVR